MDNPNGCILLIVSDPAAARSVGMAVAGIQDSPFIVEHVPSVAAGLERLKQGGITAVLLDLDLSDSEGIETFNTLDAFKSQAAILILAHPDRIEIARRAVQQGAQDYLLISHPDSFLLGRALQNAIQRKLREDELFIEKERAETVLNSIADAVISTDSGGKIISLNAVAERMTGWMLAEATGQAFANVFRVIDGMTRKPLPDPLELAIRGNKHVGVATDSILLRRDQAEIPIEYSAAPIHDRSKQVTGAVIVFHDVSEAHSMVRRMTHFAQHDFLTGLPNRLLLNDRLAQTISIARRRRKKLAVLFVDVDRFKNINDSLGHLIGDKLLQSIAQRLATCVRDSDTVSRQGGDEFVLLLADVDHTSAAEHSAAKILAVMAEKHSIAGHDIHVTLSIGISVFPEDGEDAGTLLRNADAAMYHAKASGRNNYQLFAKGMNNGALERHSLENSLRGALERRELVLHYQPKVNLGTGAITGAEVLIRWLHPAHGLLYPDQFVPIAEESGLIVPIGRWMRRQACQQACDWQKAGFPATPLAVNISAIELLNKDFLADMRDTLRETGLDPTYLEIELTESILIQDVESTMSILQELKSMGVQLAIDDFGTGYSSLSYLRQFPIDTLKIDQSFVRDIDTDHDTNTIVSAVIGMCNSLNLRVSAEGVETREQLNFLRAEHCTEGQGFYFSPGVDANAFAALHAEAGRDYAAG